MVEGRPPEERELVLRAKRGDERAFATLVRAHEQTVFRLAYVITGSAADAEDVAQEAFAKAWSALSRFRDSEPLRPWLLRIAANEARNRRRATTRRVQLALRAGRAESSGGAAPSPEATALAAEERSRLLEALGRLPLEAQLVLTCRYLLDLSEEETAAALRLRRGTVKSRTSRALERLRGELD